MKEECGCLPPLLSAPLSFHFSSISYPLILLLVPCSYTLTHLPHCPTLPLFLRFPPLITPSPPQNYSPLSIFPSPISFPSFSLIFPSPLSFPLFPSALSLLSFLPSYFIIVSRTPLYPLPLPLPYCIPYLFPRLFYPFTSLLSLLYPHPYPFQRFIPFTLCFLFFIHVAGR